MLCAMACQHMAAQAVMPMPEAYENLLKGRVKQIDEFMARFNMTETWDGKKITDRSDTVFRKKYLYTLFDYAKFRNSGGTFSDVATQFVEDVARQDCQLRYEDSTWAAEVTCSTKLGQLKLILHTEKVRQGEYKWVVSNAYGDMFDVGIPSPSSKAFISPVEHEVGFVGLLSMGKGRRNMAGLMDRHTYSPDRLSMLAALMGNGLLPIMSINKVRFHFYSVPGYGFTVEMVEKKGEYNTGWLITKLNKF